MIGAYDGLEDRFRVFLEDNFSEFQALVEDHGLLGSPIVGFNSVAFDDRLCAANNIQVQTDYDILRAVWAAAGLGPDYDNDTHAGYSLDDILRANKLGQKSGHGAQAPIDWQQGRRGAVIDYCVQDANKEYRVLRKIIDQGFIVNPKEPTTILHVDPPEGM